MQPLAAFDEMSGSGGYNSRWSKALRAAAAAIPLPQYASQPEQELRS